VSVEEGSGVEAEKAESAERKIMSEMKETETHLSAAPIAALQQGRIKQAAEQEMLQAGASKASLCR
jgi:hypothetical protein